MFYIIANAKRANSKNSPLDNVRKVFDEKGISYEIRYTQKRGDAREIAKEITSDGNENTLVVIGGDGTLHDAVNGFADFEKNTLGIIPAGTGNDFAESAGIPRDPEQAARIIADGKAYPTDFIELSNGLRSLNALGMGIDVDVLKRAYSGKSKGKSKYLKALISSLIHFKSYDFTVKYDGKEERHRGLIAAVGNGRQIGGGIKLFPDAEIDDGYLDLFIVDYLSKPKILGAFIKLMRGKVNSVKGATAVRVKEVEFLCENPDYTIQAEGELYDNVPVKARIVAGKLKIFRQN